MKKIDSMTKITSTGMILCPYDLCVLLKEAGFNYECFYYYDTNKNLKKEYFRNSTYESKIACPSIDSAVQWLRAEKNYPIQMVYSYVKDEWASCVEHDKYFWTKSYYFAMAEGIVQGLNYILHKECQIKFV